MDLIFLSGPMGMAQIVPVALALAVGLSSGMICGALLARGRSRGGAGDGVAPVPALASAASAETAGAGAIMAATCPGALAAPPLAAVTPGVALPTPGDAPTVDEPVPQAAAAPKRPARLQILPGPEQARRLLDWCIADGGVSGKLTAVEVMEIYHDMCIEQRLEPLAWNVVAPELRKLTSGDRKIYGYVGGRRLRVYQIPMPRQDAEQSTRSPARLVVDGGNMQVAA